MFIAARSMQLFLAVSADSREHRDDDNTRTVDTLSSPDAFFVFVREKRATIRSLRLGFKSNFSRQ